MKSRLLLLLLVCFLISPLDAADWPQFRGPERTGISKEKGLLKSWPKEGPVLSWTYSQAGLGYSSPAVVGDRLYLMGARGDSEFLFALDIKTKDVKEIWAVQLGPTFTWKGNNWNAGPSATPTVDGDLIFALGGGGELVCVDTSGKERWRKNLPAELGAAVNPSGGGPEKVGWGFAWSPLVDGEQLICQPGGPKGTLAALDKKTGKVLWQTKDYTDQASYASPVVAEIGGVKQYVNLTNEGLTGVATKDGRVLWRYLRKPAYDDCVIPTPIVHAGHVYATVGFTMGCDLVKIEGGGDKFTASKVYGNKNMVNQSGGVIPFDDHVFGFCDGKGWVCQDLKSGKIVWSEKRKLGNGSLVLADGHFYLYGEEEGIVVLLEASTKGWTEKGRFEIPKKSTQNKKSGKLWTHPVIANGKLYLRDQELLLCYEIK